MQGHGPTAPDHADIRRADLLRDLALAAVDPT